MKAWRMLVPALALAVGACDSSGGGAGGNVLARAGGEEFTVDLAAEILAPQVELPNQPEVAEALANLWIDYYLLARTAAEDTTLSNLDVGFLVDQQVSQEMVMELRQQVIQVDTAIAEDELLGLFEKELPGGRIRARHILFRIPDGATPNQVDSVRAQAEAIRDRLTQGEEFAALAREYSQDPGSGASGGDLGTFGRGEMVPPFEEAAFALDVGEISPVVRTSFGFHIIRLDEKVIPPFEESRDRFRSQVQNRRVSVAESTFVADIIDKANVMVNEETYGTLRELAADPSMDLTRRASDRALVTYDGGEFTVGEAQEWIQSRDPGLQGQIQGATDEQLDGLLRNLTRGELLVQEARARGEQLVPLCPFAASKISKRPEWQDVVAQ